jgi:hypothetical protein
MTSSSCQPTATWCQIIALSNGFIKDSAWNSTGQEFWSLLGKALKLSDADLFDSFGK